MRGESMAERREYKTSIPITALNKAEYDQKVIKAMETINQQGLKSDITEQASIASINPAYTLYSCNVRGYIVWQTFKSTGDDKNDRT